MVTLLTLTYTDPIHGELHVHVWSPTGLGDTSWHVNINDYFIGQIVRYNTGWKSFVKLGILSQDDLDGIMDLVENTHDY
jgi:hypothetical protein